MVVGHWAVNAFPTDHWIDYHWPAYGAIVPVAGRVCLAITGSKPNAKITGTKPNAEISGGGCE
jgi:hypothetical protein